MFKHLLAGCYANLRVLTTLAGILFLGCSGCGLAVSEQKLVIAFQPEHDEAQVLLVYDGFCVSGNSKSDLETAQQELITMFKERSAFLLFHPLLLIDLSEPDNRPGDEDARQMRKLFRETFTVCDAVIGLNREKNLGGYQTIKIRKLKRFIVELNVQLSKSFLKSSTGDLEFKKPTREPGEVESLRLIQKAAREGFQWVCIEGGRISFTLPSTPPFVEHLKHSFLEEEHKAGRHGIHMVGETTWSLEQKSDHATLSVGAGSGVPIQLSLQLLDKPEERRFQKELLAYATANWPGLNKELLTEKVVANFLAEHKPGQKP
jgi:hypothetical protein